jgi:hypothetical protein
MRPRPPPEKEVARLARDGAARPDLLKRNSSKREIRTLPVTVNRRWLSYALRERFSHPLDEGGDE